MSDLFYPSCLVVLLFCCFSQLSWCSCSAFNMEKQENLKKYLDIKQKVKVIKEVAQGKKVIEVARAFGVSVGQVYKILKSRGVISKNHQDPTFKKDSKLIKQKGKHSDIDQAVFEWVRFLRFLRGRRVPLPVSRNLIQACAIHEAKLRNIYDFKASDGWFWRWRQRYNIGKSVPMHGEAGEVNMEEAEVQMQLMRNAISSGGYQLQNIFNMDETALFYRTIPNRTYLLEGDDARQSGKGTK